MTAFKETLAGRVAAIVGGAAAIAVAAQIRLTIPGSAVPVTGQTLAVALVAGLGGIRTAVPAVLLYLAAAAAGLGVLSGGRGGWAVVTGPSVGYLVGFVAAAAVIPTLKRWAGRPHPLLIWLSIEAGSVCVLSLGAAGLVAHGLSPLDAWSRGVAPFLLGDVLKSALATAIIWAMERRGRPQQIQLKR